MSSDVETFRRVRSGDVAEPMSARTYNAVVDAARDVSAAGLGPKEGPPALPDFLPTSTEIWIRNDNGAALQQSGIAAVNQSVPVILPSISLPTFQESDAHSAIAISLGTNPLPRVVITREPIGVGAFGLAVLTGYAKVQINVTNAGHGFATATADATKLTSAENGPIEILWRALPGGVRV